jgi:carbonic anhydrase
MRSNGLTRRQVLLAAGVLPLAVGGAARADDRKNPPDDAPPKTPAEALERLKAGNQRLVEGKMLHPRQGADWRKSLTKGQAPFAAILSCSDSRVPNELLFDQGFGDLFVVRVAGNVVADDIVGSIQYAALHLKMPLLVVLGHEDCGAVSAALESIDGTLKEPKYIEELVGLVKPGLKDLDPKLKGPERLAAAVEANMRSSVRQLTGLMEDFPKQDPKTFRTIGAVYNLETGRVRWLE